MLAPMRPRPIMPNCIYVSLADLIWDIHSASTLDSPKQAWVHPGEE